MYSDVERRGESLEKCISVVPVLRYIVLESHYRPLVKLFCLIVRLQEICCSHEMIDTRKTS